jgi:Tol biopolymer transport system component
LVLLSRRKDLEMKGIVMKTSATFSPHSHLGAAILALVAFIIKCATMWEPCMAVPIQSLAARDSSIPLPAGGNGDSLDSVISPDGRYILFSSAAADLLPGHGRQFSLGVYLYDRANNGTVQVAAGDNHSMFSQISTNGRYVLFESAADHLVKGDTNVSGDIFIRDLAAGSTRMVSVASSGAAGSSSSYDASMTPDGRYVVFVSKSINLITNATGPGNVIGPANVFVRDLLSSTTALVSTGALLTSSGTAATASITPDGRYVAYFSTASGLGGTNASGSGEVYVRDLTTGVTTWASANALAIASSGFGTTNNYSSYHPVLSVDGRYLAFKTVAASNTLSGVPPIYTNGIVLQLDLQSGITTVIDTNALASGPSDEDRFGPEMTPDGRFIAFVHQEPGPAGAYSSVYLWDSQNSTSILVSDDGNGVPAGTASDTPVLSPDGRFVAFLSNATNLTANPVLNGFHIYLRDLQAGTMQLVDVDTNGVGSTDMTGVVPSLSADGRYIVFNAPDGRLVPLDNNKAQDVFLRDTVAGTTSMISERNPSLVPATGNGMTRLAQFSSSADGRWITYESSATDLVPNDTNGLSDVFADDLLTGQRMLVSAGLDGHPARGGHSAHGVISGDGRYVVFLSSATNVVTNAVTRQTNGNLNVFRRDLQTATTVLVGTNNCSTPLVSSDGRYVVFQSSGPAPLAPGILLSGVFWQDMVTGTRMVLTNTSAPLNPSGPFLSMSTNGQYVSYLFYSNGISTGLRVRNTSTGIDVYTNTAPINSAALSPDGSRMMYLRTNSPLRVYVDDLMTGNNLFSFPSSTSIQSSTQWSGDSRYVVFVSATNTIAGDTNQNSKVYLCDLQTLSVTLVSVNVAHSRSAQGVSDMPVLTGDGRFVVYRSTAMDLVPFDSNPGPKLFIYDQLTAVNTVFSAAGSGSGWVSIPTVSANGANITFQTVGFGAVPGDLNRMTEGFVGGLDMDGDGIPDWWMLQYFGHPTGQSSDLSLAQDDADGDGVSNLQEYLNGTNPRSASGDFAVQIVPIVSQPHTAVLMWPASVATSFTLQHKNSLSDSQWLNLPGSASISGNRCYFTVSTSASGGFYRVVGN